MSPKTPQTAAILRVEIRPPTPGLCRFGLRWVRQCIPPVPCHGIALWRSLTRGCRGPLQDKISKFTASQQAAHAAYGQQALASCRHYVRPPPRTCMRHSCAGRHLRKCSASAAPPCLAASSPAWPKILACFQNSPNSPYSHRRGHLPPALVPPWGIGPIIPTREIFIRAAPGPALHATHHIIKAQNPER